MFEIKLTGGIVRDLTDGPFDRAICYPELEVELLRGESVIGYVWETNGGHLYYGSDSFDGPSVIRRIFGPFHRFELFVEDGGE